ncbi:hypothetical protein BJ546DRAFT_20526 [Cryomyces antarcticus]
MPSHLRTSFEPLDTTSTQSYSPKSSPTSPAHKKQRMSVSQTYSVARTARSKLGREASKADHDLRVLVGHANLLDTLMVELADAEKEQEAWFHQTVQKAAESEDARHIQWVDTIVEEDFDDNSSESSDDSSDSDSDIYDEDAGDVAAAPSPAHFSISETEIGSDDEEEYEDYEYTEELTLRRSLSHSHQPPGLVDDSDSEDDSMPPSPEQPALEFTEKERQAIATTTYYDEKDASDSIPTLSTSEQTSFLHNGYFIPERNTAPMVAAC